MSVCVCDCNALTFGSLNLISLYLVGGYIFRIFRSRVGLGANAKIRVTTQSRRKPV